MRVRTVGVSFLKGCVCARVLLRLHHPRVGLCAANGKPRAPARRLDVTVRLCMACAGIARLQIGHHEYNGVSGTVALFHDDSPDSPLDVFSPPGVITAGNAFGVAVAMAGPYLVAGSYLERVCADPVRAVLVCVCGG